MQITRALSIGDHEIEITAIRAQGAGGQHLHKTASAAHLRFDIAASSLPAVCKTRLLQSHDRRISGDGVLVIKAQAHRSFERNRVEAQQRLASLIRRALVVPRPRKATRPSAACRRRRLENKRARSNVKANRRRLAPAPAD